MQVTGDLRYVTPGEYAAFADRQQRRAGATPHSTPMPRRSSHFYHQRDPSLSRQGDPRRLDRRPIRSARSSIQRPGRRPANLAAGRRACRPSAKVGDTLFVHGGISANYALVPLDEINRRARAALQPATVSEAAIINDPMGPLWYRGLITRAGGAPRPRPRRRSTAELDGVAARARGQAAGHRPHARPQGHRHPARRQAGPDRYRHLALLQGQARLAGDPRRPGDPPCSDQERADETDADALLRVGGAARRPRRAAAAEPAKPLFAPTT